MIFKKL